MAQTPEEQKASRQKHYLEHREESLAYQRDYRSKNREKVRASNREYDMLHRDARREYDREHRIRDPKKVKAHDKEYRIKNRDKVTAYRRANRERSNAHQREYRKRDTEAVKAWKEREKIRKRKYFLEKHDHVTARAKERIAWFYDVKRTMKCSSCGQSFPDCPDVIDFHHRGEASKISGIGSMVTGKAPKSRILAEIEKCTPLCANCHRKLHYDLKKKQKGKKGLDLLDFF